jgi:uncharacterized membrane protein
MSFVTGVSMARIMALVETIGFPMLLGEDDGPERGSRLSLWIARVLVLVETAVLRWKAAGFLVLLEMTRSLRGRLVPGQMNRYGAVLMLVVVVLLAPGVGVFAGCSSATLLAWRR